MHRAGFNFKALNSKGKLMAKVPMTLKGAETLSAELTDLKSVQRPRVIASIAEAREHGDLKENAEYHAAREQQSFIEGRIADYEYKLSNAQVIDITSIAYSGRVIFGTTVTLLDIDKDIELVYQLVGENEADVKINKISITSPIARALIAKEVGDEVNVITPAGTKTFEIIEIKHI